LQGDNLEELASNNNRPIQVWGTISNTEDGILIIQVERYELLFPEVNFQLLKGTEQSAEVNGETVVLFAAEAGKTYLELASNCFDKISYTAAEGMGGKVGDAVLLETLSLPDVTVGGYPTVCVNGMALAVDPVTKKPTDTTDMLMFASQPNAIPELSSADQNPTLTIETAELVYYVPDQRYTTPNGEPVYVQPVWRFYGHFSNGQTFEMFIQALDQKYLLPETTDYPQPG
jgi:hypothetical protein